jgi:S-adenosylmethionine:diacylglycerol 3-amino-3-carboxypropyl transferase
LRAAFAHWKSEQSLVQPHYDKQARERSLMILVVGVQERVRKQLLKVALWDIKDHADDLKKNSIQAMLMEGAKAGEKIVHRTTLDLVRLDTK